MSLLYIIVLFVAGFVDAQDDLSTFAAVKTSLLQGAELQLVVDPALCTVNVAEEVVVSLSLRHWQHFAFEDGSEEIRADDLYVDTQDIQSISWISRAATIFDNNTALITIKRIATASPGDAHVVSMACELGAGADIHLLSAADDLVTLSYYEELKLHLMLGDHVEAIVNTKECESFAGFPRDYDLIFGHTMQNYKILNEGTPFELMEFYSTALVRLNGSSFTLGSEILVLNSVGVDVGVVLASVDFLLNIENQVTARCQMGSAIRFVVHERESEDTYTSYSAVKDAALTGHDVEVVIEAGKCTLLEGNPDGSFYQTLFQRYDNFKIRSSEPAGDEPEFIEFNSGMTLVPGPDGIFLLSHTTTVSDDDTVEFSSFTYTFSTGLTSKWKLDCPFIEASLFHAVPSKSLPAANHHEITTAMVDQGRLFGVVINAVKCDSEEEGQSGLTGTAFFGAVAWQSYLETSTQSFSTNLFTLTTNVQAASAGLAWEGSTLRLTPDNRVEVIPAVYDFLTGENLALGQQTPVNCELNGSEQGGVTFYPFP